MTVYFHKNAQKYAENKDALAAARKAISSLKKKSSAYHPLTQPAILRMKYIPAEKLPDATETYFQKKDLLAFSALFPALSHPLQQRYAAEAFEADDIAIFSIILDTLDDAAMRQYAKKAAKEEKLDFLMILLDELELTPKELKRCAEISYAHGNIACFCILADHFDVSVIRYYTDKSVQDGNTAFLSILLDRSRPKAADLERYAATAYKDGDIASFHILMEYMSAKEKRTWKKRAKEDGDVMFYHILTDEE